MKTVWTYFAVQNDHNLSADGNCFVKIGKSVNPWSRVHEAQTWNPVGIFLLLAVQADIENQLHRRLRRHHFGLEWFVGGEDFWHQARAAIRELAPGARTSTSNSDL